MGTDSTAVQDAPTVDAQPDASAAGPADAASSRAMVSVAGVVRGDRVSITNGLVGAWPARRSRSSEPSSAPRSAPET